MQPGCRCQARLAAALCFGLTRNHRQTAVQGKTFPAHAPSLSPCTQAVSDSLLLRPRHIGHNFYYGTGPGLPEACIRLPCLLLTSEHALLLPMAHCQVEVSAPLRVSRLGGLCAEVAL